MFCLECSVIQFRDLGTTTERAKRLEAFEMWIWRIMERENG